jgi:hypothetical protein
MAKQLTFDNLKDPNFKSERSEATSYRLIDGVKVDSRTQSGDAQTLAAAQTLSRNGFGESTDALPISETSLGVLEAIGCTVMVNAEEYGDYSLLTGEDNSVANPNIAVDLTNKRNEQILATPMFPNSSDPFYEMDAKPSRKVELIRKQSDSTLVQQGYIKLAADISTLNTQTSTKILKYFK